jgi:crossover junction endodeoxyribonuclease RuvC
MTIALGIDPGSRITGFGVVCREGSRLHCLDFGVIRLANTETFAGRLTEIFKQIDGLIKLHQPQEFAIEQVFVNKNVNSALKLGQARGAAIVAAGVHDLPVFEYSPNEIKKAVVGRGHAMKGQIQLMTSMLLNLTAPPSEDAGDALACAICHLNRGRFA